MQEVLQSVLKTPIIEKELQYPGLQLIANLPLESSLNKKPEQKQRSLRQVTVPSDLKCAWITQNRQQKIDPKLTISWCVPKLNGDCYINLCFHVREVQQYIVVQTQGDLSRPCPMFCADQLRIVLATAKIDYVTIPDMMDEEFKSIFMEFDGFPITKKKLQTDRVMLQVLQALQDFIRKEYAQGENGKLVGIFWRFTQKAMQLFDKALDITLWLLENPYYLRIAMIVARTIRLVICIYTSFNDISKIVMEALKEKLKWELVGFPLFIFELAFEIVLCFQSVYALDIAAVVQCLGPTLTNAKFALNMADTYLPEFISKPIKLAKYFGVNTVSNTLTFIASEANKLFGEFGITYFAQFGKYLHGHEAEMSNVVGLGYDATLTQNAADGMRSWSFADLNIRAIIFFVDVLIVAIDISHLPLTFVDKITNLLLGWMPSKIKLLIQEALKAKLTFLVPYAIITRPLRILLVILKRLLGIYGYVELVFDALREVRLWITDLFPCLFKYVMRLMLQVLTFGYYRDTIPDLSFDKIGATCCLSEEIQILLKTMVFGEAERKLNVKHADLKQKRSEVSWWDYLSSGEATVQLQKDARGLWREEGQLANQRYDAGVPISTYTTKGADDTLQRLYAYGQDYFRDYFRPAQTETMQTKKFFRRIFLLPSSQSCDALCTKRFAIGDDFFELHLILNTKHKAVSWCLDRNEMTKKYPRSMWRYYDRDYVLPRHIPDRLLLLLLKLNGTLYQIKQKQ